VALVPAAVVTVMWTVAADSAGEVATTWVAVFDVIVPAVDPKLTLVAPDRVLPVIVTDVPPAAGPLVGLTPLTVGTLALTIFSSIPIEKKVWELLEAAGVIVEETD
jgi:hypothetical protein